MARARLTAMQAHHCSSEGALSSLEEAIGDKEKQMAQLREQRDRAEQEKQEERELHEREIVEYKMKIHALESEVSPCGSLIDSFLHPPQSISWNKLNCTSIIKDISASFIYF